MNQGAGIVTTLINAGAVLDSFITYHLSIGFEHIFLFFDDPNDPSIEQARKYSNVTITVNDDELKKRWKSSKLYAADKLMARRARISPITERQSLNVEIALELAREKGLDWLLHIDIDELFYAPGRQVGEYFQALSDRGIRYVRYLNYEGIPEKPDIDNFFSEVTLFKKHPRSFGDQNREQKRALIREVFADRYYLFYMLGKSAAKVADGVLPEGVHGFMLPDEQKFSALLMGLLINNPLTRRAYKNKLFAKFIDYITNRHGRLLSLDPVVLHYPCCGFEHFWNKYIAMGRFPDPPGITTLPFHSLSRDVVQEGDREKARSFYIENAVISDQAAIDRLIEGDICCRILEPSAIIASKATAKAGLQSFAE